MPLTEPVLRGPARRDPDPFSDLDPCTRIRLETGTETLADIPQVALDVVGIRAPVPRSVKPWLDTKLRADGTART